MEKYKTTDGRPARILATDLPGDYPVAAVVFGDTQHFLWQLTKDLKVNPLREEPFLIEITPWNNIKIDDRVLVKNKVNEVWLRRHFAGIKNSMPTTFQDGRTSWSDTVDGVTISWIYCEACTD